MYNCQRWIWILHRSSSYGVFLIIYHPFCTPTFLDNALQLVPPWNIPSHLNAFCWVFKHWVYIPIVCAGAPHLHHIVKIKQTPLIYHWWFSFYVHHKHEIISPRFLPNGNTCIHNHILLQSSHSTPQTGHSRSLSIFLPE